MKVTEIVDGQRDWINPCFCALREKKEYSIFIQALLESGFRVNLVDEGMYFLESSEEYIEMKVDLHTGYYRIINFQTESVRVEDSDNLFNEIRSAWRQVRKAV